MQNPDEGDMLRTQAIAEASFYPVSSSFLNRKRGDFLGEKGREDLEVAAKYFKQIQSPSNASFESKKRSHRRSKSTFQTSYQ